MHLIKTKTEKKNQIKSKTFVHQVNNATTRAENVFLGVVKA